MTAPTTQPLASPQLPSYGGAPMPGAKAGFLGAFSGVYAGQLARARVVRMPLLFVAGLQSVGILLLLRLVLGADHGSARVVEGRAQVVAGCAVLVLAFLGVNLLAQRFGALRASGALDYYASLPVPAVPVVLATAAAYATFAAPATLVTGAVGVALFHLAWSGLALLVVLVPLAGIALAGVGAFLGLAIPRAELATVAGQLGMSAVIFLDLTPADRLPTLIQPLRAAIPSTYAADALAAALRGRISALSLGGDLAVCAGVAAVTLWLATVAYHRAVRR